MSDSVCFRTAALCFLHRTDSAFGGQTLYNLYQFQRLPECVTIQLLGIRVAVEFCIHFRWSYCWSPNFGFFFGELETAFIFETKKTKDHHHHHRHHHLLSHNQHDGGDCFRLAPSKEGVLLGLGISIATDGQSLFNRDCGFPDYLFLKWRPRRES